MIQLSIDEILFERDIHIAVHYTCYGKCIVFSSGHETLSSHGLAYYNSLNLYSPCIKKYI